jgi:hypothetical protein
MKIVQQTPDQLTLRKLPSLLTCLLGGLFIVVALGVIFIFSDVITLACHRDSSQAQCELVTAGLLRSSTQVLELEKLREARVESAVFSDRIVLLTTAGEIPLTGRFGGWDDKAQIADYVNAFIFNPSQSDLTVQQGNRGLGYAGGLLVAAVGLLIFVPACRVTTCTFDKARGRVTLKRQGLLGSMTSELALRDVASVQIREAQFISRGKSRPGYQVILVTNSGEHFPLAHHLSGDLQAEQTIAAGIRAFLHLDDKSLWGGPQFSRPYTASSR